MRLGFRVGIACQYGVDDRLLPFAYGLGEGFYLGDAVVVRAPDVEAGELVADRAGRGGDMGAGEAQGEQVAQVLLGDPDGGDLLAVGVGVQHADDGGQVIGVQVLDVVAEHVVQRAGQPDATITVGTSPNGVAVNAVTDTAYVANAGSGTVSVINGRTNTVTATIPVGNQPTWVAINSVTDTVYVANAGSGTVSVINGRPTPSPPPSRSAIDPFGVAVNP